MLDFLEIFGLDDDEDNGIFEGESEDAEKGISMSGMEPEEDFLMSGTELKEDMCVVDGDAERMLLDSAGDGIPDLFVTEQYMDTNEDGLPDLFLTDIGRDTDGDGIVDDHSVITGMDLDGDGIIDLMEVAEDFDNDGLFDSVQEFADPDGDGMWDSLGENMNPMDGNAPAYEQFDPYSTEMEHIVGNPAEEMGNWHWQETDSSCAVASQEFILERLTGREFEESELRELAEEQGWYDLYGGTTMSDVGNILEHMGLTVERSHGNSMENMERCLKNGGEVIACVDGLELWLGEDNDLFGPGMDANHAVQVIGIDHSNAGHSMVILNDPGAANGGGAMIPMDVFMGAWEDSGCFMVEAYA